MVKDWEGFVGGSKFKYLKKQKKPRKEKQIKKGSQNKTNQGHIGTSQGSGMLLLCLPVTNSSLNRTMTMECFHFIFAHKFHPWEWNHFRK